MRGISSVELNTPSAVTCSDTHQNITQNDESARRKDEVASKRPRSSGVFKSAATAWEEPRGMGLRLLTEFDTTVSDLEENDKPDKKTHKRAQGPGGRAM